MLPTFRVRAEALGKLAYFLAHEEESLYKMPLFSELDVTNLTNLLLTESPRSLQDEDTGRSVFQVSNIITVLQADTILLVHLDLI